MGGFLAALPALITAGSAVAGGIGSLIGGKKAATSPTFRREEELGDIAKQQGADYWLPQAKESLEPAANFWRGLLSGDRNAIMRAIAPEASTVLSQYDTARKTMAELAPRGGGRAESMAEMEWQKAGDLNRLIQRARPEAARELTAIGAQQAGVGENLLSMAGGSFGQQLNYLLAKGDQSARQYGQLGYSLGRLLNVILGAGKGKGEG